MPGNYTRSAMKGHLWMLIGLLGGLGFGWLAWVTQNPGLLAFASWVKPLGDLFTHLLSMVAIPLVCTALFGGVAGLGNLRQVGRLGVRTLAFYWSTTLVAILIGMVVAAALLPLAPAGLVAPALRAVQAADTTAIQQAVDQMPTGARFIVELIPSNPIRAAVEGNLLPLIVFVSIFAVATAGLPDEKRQILTELADVATQSLIKIVYWVLWLAPVGIFALVAPTVAQLGGIFLREMFVFFAAVILGLVIFIAVIYLPAVATVAKMKVARFLQATIPSLLMAFSTTSSIATLPTMLQAAEADLRVSRTVAGFALPLGASVNRAGSALYQAVAVLFVAQLYGVPLGFAQIFQAGAAVFLASLTVASVPSASVVSLEPAFLATGLPLQGLTLLIGLDRIPDMFRTLTNVAGHLAGTTVVAAIEGEKLE